VLIMSDNELVNDCKNWLANKSLNKLGFNFIKSNKDELIIGIPSLSTGEAKATFAISLAKPHGINTDSAVLEEFEADSFQFCFGDEQRQLKDILEYATVFLLKDSQTWANNNNNSHNNNEA